MQSTQEGKEVNKSNHTQVKVYNVNTSKFLNPNSFMPIAETLWNNIGNIKNTNKEPFNKKIKK